MTETGSTQQRVAAATDLTFQARILPRVSRTFALTIPQLPVELSTVVANAYLLCRLADTIEDDPDLDSDAKSEFMAEFLAAVKGEADPESFARSLAPRLSRRMPDAEHELVANTATVLRITASFTPAQYRALRRCVTTMGKGMPEYQRHKTLDGLTNLEDLDRYCYFVAGVVGEMLTDLFCEHNEEIAAHRDEMMALSVCFGQGLQMTNILKDIWEDRSSETCWLPRNLFANLAGGLAGAIRNRDGVSMQAGITKLIGIAHAHLRAALKYTQMIPKKETGMRRFCLWAIAMAIMTLRKIHDNPGYQSGQEVKISRNAVRAAIAASNLALYSNRALTVGFEFLTRDLPLNRAANLCPPPGARLASDRLA